MDRDGHPDLHVWNQDGGNLMVIARLIYATFQGGVRTLLGVVEPASMLKRGLWPG